MAKDLSYLLLDYLTGRLDKTTLKNLLCDEGWNSNKIQGIVSLLNDLHRKLLNEELNEDNVIVKVKELLSEIDDHQ